MTGPARRRVVSVARPCFSEKGRVDVEINKVAQVGAGYMGGGIAQSLANAGFQVRLADVDADATRKAHERLLVEAEQFQTQGLFPPGSTDRIRENLHVAPSIEEAVADVDFVEEAVPEVPGIKRDVLARVEAAARPGTIIGTNTSTIPVHVLAEGLKDPSRFLTVHWSNPAPFIPGVEIVAGDRTDRSIIPVVERMLARAGRRSAQVADVPGFVLNRLQYVLLKEAMSIVEEGVATATDIDTIVTSTFGFRLPFFGPFAIADMAGLDVYANGFTTLEEAFGERLAAPKVLTDLVAQGKFGVKSGSGFLELDPEKRDALIAYRNKAYSAMNDLLRELGPSPLADGS
jgi:3-hydroxybutyryl-CoA dehydrogenase